MKERRRSMPADKNRAPRIPQGTFRWISDEQLLHPAHPCARCEYLKTEAAAPEHGRQMTFLRCMAPGEWKGRTLEKVPAEYAEAVRRSLPVPAWCVIASRREAAYE